MCRHCASCSKPRCCCSLTDVRTIATGVAVGLSVPVAIGLWLALAHWLPPVTVDPMRFVLGCIGVAALLGSLPGIEAVAHERLFSRAIDPLAGADSRRLIVNQRYVTNTLEQFWVFAPGLALLGANAGDLRAVAATTIIWIIGRWAFWSGYHRDPMLRGIGACSLAQSLVVLAWGVGAFGMSWRAGTARQRWSGRSWQSRSSCSRYSAARQGTEPPKRWRVRTTMPPAHHRRINCSTTRGTSCRDSRASASALRAPARARQCALPSPRAAGARSATPPLAAAGSSR